MTLEDFFETREIYFISFDTPKEALEFLKECGKRNLLWNSDLYAVERNYREQYDDVCYSINLNNRLCYKHIAQIPIGRTIINYKNLIKEDMTKPDILRAIYDSI